MNRYLLVALLFVCSPSVLIAGTQSAGIVKAVTGQASITSRSQVTVQAVANMKISNGDTIRTGGDGRIGIIFDDDTSLSLGPNSEIEIQDFLFQPADHKLSLIARLIKGTFSFISGQIAKLAPERFEVKTPDATLGVRGTTFVVRVET